MDTTIAPASYTVLPDTNTTPTFGTQGKAVVDLQNQLNAKNAGSPGYKPLVPDGKYGPLTAGATTFKPTPPPNPGIVSSTAANNALTAGGNALDTMTNQPDPYEQYLTNKANSLMTTPDTPGTDEKNAASAGAKLQTKAETDFAAYKAGLETLGIQSGLSKYAPGLQADRMINAANNETQKLSDIQDKEQLTIAKAKQARIDKNATVLKDTLSELRQIKQDKATELQHQLSKRTQDITVAKAAAPHLLTALKGLDPAAHEAMILQTAKDNNVNPSTLVDALTQEAYTQQHDANTLAIQQKTLDKVSGGSDAILTPSVLATLTKSNPILNLPYGTTKQEALGATAAADAFTKAVSTDFGSNDTSIVGKQGYLTYDYVKKLTGALPATIDKVNFLTKLYNDNMLTPKLDKHAADYGISKAEATKIMGK